MMFAKRLGLDDQAIIDCTAQASAALKTPSTDDGTKTQSQPEPKSSLTEDQGPDVLGIQMLKFGKQFVCSSHNGAITHAFVQTVNPARELYTVSLERHTGPCSCSFCSASPLGVRVKRRGNGWNMIHWATPWARWYFRWVRRGCW